MKKSEFIIAYTLAHGDLPNSQLMDILNMNNCFDPDEEQTQPEQTELSPLIDRLYEGAHLKLTKPLLIKKNILLPIGFVVKCLSSNENIAGTCKIYIYAVCTRSDGRYANNIYKQFGFDTSKLDKMFEITDQPLSMIHDNVSPSGRFASDGVQFLNHKYKYIINPEQQP